MGVRRYHDLIAWQLADAFKTEAYRLVNDSIGGLGAWKYREQLLDSAGAVPKDIAEGFVRYSPSQFSQFLGYALASLVEAEEWLKDAVVRKYLSPKEAEAGLLLAKRTWNATLRLKQSQDREVRRRRRDRRGPAKRRPPQSQPPDDSA